LAFDFDDLLLLEDEEELLPLLLESESSLAAYA
jgi:hypothetical protein